MDSKARGGVGTHMSEVYTTEGTCSLTEQSGIHKQEVVSSVPVSTNLLCTLGKALYLTCSCSPRSVNRGLFKGEYYNLSTNKFVPISHGCCLVEAT